MAHRSRLQSSRLLAFAAVAVAIAAAPTVQAQSYYWQGGGYDNWFLTNWYNADTGTFNQFPPQTPTLALYFGPFADSNGLVNNDVTDNFLLGSLNYSNQAWHQTGKSLLFHFGGSINVASSSSFTQIDNAVILNNTLQLNSATGLEMTGVLSGTGGLIKTGVGYARLDASATYTGGTTVSGGNLIVKTLNGSYTDNAVLSTLNDSDQNYSGVISGSGAFGKSGAGTLTLSGINTYSGLTTVFSGRLVDNNPHGNYKNDAALELAPSSDLYYGGVISGTGSVVFSGGQTRLLAKSTYGGSTTVNNSLVYFVDAALPTSTSLIVNGSLSMSAGFSQTVSSLSGAGTVYLNGATLTVNGSADSTYSGEMSYAAFVGAGALVKTGTSTLNLTGINLYNGGTTVNGGTLVDAHPHANYTANGSGTVEFRTATDLSYALPIAGTGFFTKSGLGNLTLTGFSTIPNTYVSGGTLTDGVDGALASATSLTVGNDGTYDLKGHAQTVNSIAGNGKILLGSGGALTAKTGTFAGVISGAGSFTAAGINTIGFVAQNTYTGGTTINAAARIEDFYPHGNYVDNGSLELTLITDQTFGGVISGPGSLTVDGPGYLTLTGQSTFTGTTFLQGIGLKNGADNALPVGTTLSFNSANTYNLNGFAQTISTILGTGGVTLGGGALTFSGPDTTISGVITGGGTVTKASNSTVTFSGQNNYTGGTNVTGGRLIEQNPHGDYSLQNNAALEFAHAGDQAFFGKVSGTGSLTKSGDFNLTLNTNNLYSGATTLSAGTLTNGGSNNLPTTTALTVNSGATYNLNGKSQTLVSLASAGTVALGGGALTLSSASDTTLTGALSGLGTLTKSGAGTLSVATAQAYTGATTISVGKVRLATTNALPTATALTISSGATLDLNTKAQTVGSLDGTGAVSLNGGAFTVGNSGSSIWSGVISGAGSVTKAGTGTLKLLGQNTFTTANLNAGTLRNGIANALSPAAQLSMSSGTTYDLNGFGQTLASLAGTGTVTLGAANLHFAGGTGQNFAGVISGIGGLFVDSGSQSLSGSNTYSGGTTVSGGKLILSGNDSLPATTALNIGSAAGSIFDLSGYNQTIGSLTGSGHIVFGLLSNLTVNSAGNATYSGIISDSDGYSGDLIKTGVGTLTLTGANTYAGSTNVLAGGLIDMAPHSFYKANGSLELHNDDDRTITGVSGSGSVMKTGSGVLTIGSSTSFGGTTTISNGRVIEQNPGGSYVNNAVLEFSIGGTKNAGSITGTGSVVKSGSGELDFGAGATYTGGTTVQAGRLVVSNPIGAYVTNGNLDFRSPNNLTYATPITGTGKFSSTGSGTVTLSGINTYTGGTYLLGGTLIDQHPHGTYQTYADLQLVNQNDVTVDGVLATDPAYAFGGSAGNLTKSGPGTLTIAQSTHLNMVTVNQGRLIMIAPENGNYTTNADLEFSIANSFSPNWPITGTGNFTKSGSGTMSIFQNNLSYAGTTTVNEGTLAIMNDFVIPKTSQVIVNANGTLNLNSRRMTLASLSGSGAVTMGYGYLTVDGTADTTFSGIISGQDTQYGIVTKSGTGTLTLTGVNTYQAGTIITGGRLVDANPHDKYTLSAGSTLEFAPAGPVSYVGTGISGTGAFVKGGVGTLTLTAALPSTVTMQVANGALKGNTTIFNRDISSTGGTLQFDQASNGVYSKTYSGTGALLKTGTKTLTLTNGVSNTGGVQVSGGTLILTGNASVAGGLTTDSGATFFNLSGSSLAIGGRTINQGEIDTTAGGTTDFTGLVSGAGLFGGAGNVRFDGGFSPGNSPAAVTLQGDMTLGSANDLTMELGGLTPGTGYDHLNVFGNAALDGNLIVAYYGGFTASLGQSFDLFDFAQETGAFSSITLPTLSHGLAWNTSGLYSNGTISVQAQAVPEPASFAVLGFGGLALLRRGRK